MSNVQCPRQNLRLDFSWELDIEYCHKTKSGLAASQEEKRQWNHGIEHGADNSEVTVVSAVTNRGVNTPRSPQRGLTPPARHSGG